MLTKSRSFKICTFEYRLALQMLQKFQQHIQNEFSFLHGKKLLVAISGGIDSVVLTHLLSNLNYGISLESRRKRC